MPTSRTAAQRADDAYSFIVIHLFKAADGGRPPKGPRFALIWVKVVLTAFRYSPRFMADDFIQYWDALSDRMTRWPGLTAN